MDRRLWRTGRKVGRTVYAMNGTVASDDDPLIGTMDSPALAADCVEGHNIRLGLAVEASSPAVREGLAVLSDAHLVRDILEACCEERGISLDSTVQPGEPARNYELAVRLGIGAVFGLPRDPVVAERPGTPPPADITAAAASQASIRPETPQTGSDGSLRSPSSQDDTWNPQSLKETLERFQRVLKDREPPRCPEHTTTLPNPNGCTACEIHQAWEITRHETRRLATRLTLLTLFDH